MRPLALRRRNGLPVGFLGVLNGRDQAFGHLLGLLDQRAGILFGALLDLLRPSVGAQLNLGQPRPRLVVLGALGEKRGVVCTHAVQRFLRLVHLLPQSSELLLGLVGLLLRCTDFGLERRDGLVFGLLFGQDAVPVGDQRLGSAVGVLLFLGKARTLLLGLL